MINDKYQELLQTIAKILAVKNIEIENLHEEIGRLNRMIADAEKGQQNEQKRN